MDDEDSERHWLDGPNDLDFGFYIDEISYQEMVCEFRIHFTIASEYHTASKITPVPGIYDSMVPRYQAEIRNHCLMLLQKNYPRYKRLQCWMDEDELLLFILIPGIENTEEPMFEPDKDGTIIDAAPLSSFDLPAKPDDPLKRWFNQ